MWPHASAGQCGLCASTALDPHRHLQVICFCSQKNALESNWQYSDLLLQSDCSHLFLIALSLQQECLYIAFPCSEDKYCAEERSNLGRAFSKSAIQQFLRQLTDAEDPKCHACGLLDLFAWTGMVSFLAKAFSRLHLFFARHFMSTNLPFTVTLADRLGCVHHRENVLFGKEFEQERYSAVLQACALEADVDQMHQGDSTLIGDRGVTLSGGQRARLSLARAIYQVWKIGLPSVYRGPRHDA